MIKGIQYCIISGYWVKVGNISNAWILVNGWKCGTNRQGNRAYSVGVWKNVLPAQMSGKRSVLNGGGVNLSADEQQRNNRRHNYVVAIDGRYRITRCTIRKYSIELSETPIINILHTHLSYFRGYFCCGQFGGRWSVMESSNWWRNKIESMNKIVPFRQILAIWLLWLHCAVPTLSDSRNIGAPSQVNMVEPSEILIEDHRFC